MPQMPCSECAFRRRFWRFEFRPGLLDHHGLEARTLVNLGDLCGFLCFNRFAAKLHQPPHSSVAFAVASGG
jgi:hypothetical protein